MTSRRWILDLIPRGGICAEIGVWKGEFSLRLLTRLPRLLCLVDPWIHVPGYKDAKYGGDIGQPEMERIYRRVRGRLGWLPNVDIYRLPSVDASKLFPDETFHFVYIDGDHTYEAVREDLDAWWPKVRRGGVLSGDDYTTDGWWGDGVTKAVDEFPFPATVRARQWVIRRPQIA